MHGVDLVEFEQMEWKGESKGGQEGGWNVMLQVKCSESRAGKVVQQHVCQVGRNVWPLIGSGAAVRFLLLMHV
jgi:hypothetical protein